MSQRSEKTEMPHCMDHSGILTWLRAIVGISTAAVGLLGYSVFWQAPNIRLDVVREIARLDQRTALIEKKVEAIDCRLTKLEDKTGK